MNRILNLISVLSNWTVKLVYLNGLWLLGVAAGAVVFGVGPSTNAMFAVTRKWIMGETDVSLWKIFYTCYRKEFLRSNGLALFLLAVGGILVVDVHVALASTGHMPLIEKLGTLSFLYAYCIVGLYIFPLFAHYQCGVFQYLKLAVVVGVKHIFLTISMTIILALIVMLFRLIPGFIPFFSGSVTSVILTLLVHRGLHKVPKFKQEKETIA